MEELKAYHRIDLRSKLTLPKLSGAYIALDYYFKLEEEAGCRVI
jgi:hypothetical protein